MDKRIYKYCKIIPGESLTTQRMILVIDVHVKSQKQQIQHVQIQG